MCAYICIYVCMHYVQMYAYTYICRHVHTCVDVGVWVGGCKLLHYLLCSSDFSHSGV